MNEARRVRLLKDQAVFWIGHDSCLAGLQTLLDFGIRHTREQAAAFQV